MRSLRMGTNVRTFVSHVTIYQRVSMVKKSPPESLRVDKISGSYKRSVPWISVKFIMRMKATPLE